MYDAARLKLQKAEPSATRFRDQPGELRGVAAAGVGGTLDRIDDAEKVTIYSPIELPVT